MKEKIRRRRFATFYWWCTVRAIMESTAKVSSDAWKFQICLCSWLLILWLYAKGHAAASSVQKPRPCMVAIYERLQRHPNCRLGKCRDVWFCFEGLPEESTLAISTNGCFTDQGKECYRQGFKEMCSRLHPAEILVVGRPIDVDTDVKITYRESFGQQLTRKLRGWHGQ